MRIYYEMLSLYWDYLFIEKLSLEVLSLSDQQGQFLCLDTFTFTYVNLDFSQAETFYLVEHQLDSFFALKLDKNFCPVII